MSPENTRLSSENPSAYQRTTPQNSSQQQLLKCPRCDSFNTKFCYYNNNSLAQPRHFCKNCRRYWTRGGSLRIVPVGGGCRKNKKLMKPIPIPTSTPNPSFPTSTLFSSGGGEVESAPGFKFPSHQNLNPEPNPTIEFQLGGIALSNLHPATAQVYAKFISSSVPITGYGHVTEDAGGYLGMDLRGLNYSVNPSSHSQIESLSSINQEMHWKLQEERMNMIYGPSLHEINMFQNLANNTNNNNNDDIARKIMEVDPTEWLFDDQI